MNLVTLKTLTLILLQFCAIAVGAQNVIYHSCPECGHLSVKGDVDEDGKLSVTDVSGLIQLLMGKPLTFVTSISLSSTNIILQQGEGHQLFVTYVPKNADLKAVVWSSSDNGVASVSEGVIMGNLPGTATITARTIDGGDVFAECFVTVEGGVTNTIGDHEYVNLGLTSGTLWATVNIGATSPEGHGYLYAWGETSVAETYSQETYSMYDSTAETYTKYCMLDKYGEVDDLSELLAVDDVASVLWGASWTMPTSAQFYELLSECNFTWQSEGSKIGYDVEGPNGNHIFLPVTGCNGDSGLKDEYIRGYYWSKTLVPAVNNKAYYLNLKSDVPGVANYPRYNGFAVRPVAPGL